jgi:hypothetical protein
MIQPITPEEFAWTNQQPVTGAPSLTRLRAGLEAAGLRPVELVLDADGTSMEFRLERGPSVRQMDREQTLRRLITTFRASGFEVGFVELGVGDFDDEIVSGFSLVAPLETIGEQIPVLIHP